MLCAYCNQDRKKHDGEICPDSRAAYLRNHPTSRFRSRCSDELRKQGQAYPRSCLECGLGPCKRSAGAEGAAVQPPAIPSDPEQYFFLPMRRVESSDPPQWMQDLTKHLRHQVLDVRSDEWFETSYDTLGDIIREETERFFSAMAAKGNGSRVESMRKGGNE